jgi:hypothetical protein
MHEILNHTRGKTNEANQILHAKAKPSEML